MKNRETQIVVALSIIVAATRLLALSRSIWDWDEALFCLALRSFDVAQHHPHPPGFPLYIGLAKLMRLVIPDDFRALRTVQLIASCFVFPSFYALARAMRYPFTLAVSAALLFAFLPNVWFYGGTAFSDILNVVLFLTAAAFLFADAQPRSGAATYFLGTFFFSLSLLVRPQNVLMAFPWFAATWPRVRARRFGTIAAAMALSIVVVAIGYGAAAYLTGPRAWLETNQKHSHYIAHVDGFLNPIRPPVLSLFYDFVVDPFEGGKAPRLLFAFAVAALFRPKRRDFEALATFTPFLIFALFMLNATGTSRLSIGYMPLLVLLAVDGMALIAETLSIAIRQPRAAAVIQLLCVAVVAGRFIVWTLPALRVVHSTPSPPVQAMNWIRTNVPRGSSIYVGGAISPHAEYYLTGYDVHTVDADTDASVQPSRNAWFVSDSPPTAGDAIVFQRPRPKLWALFTRRDFLAEVHPIAGAIRYVSGWYDQETSGSGTAWRWMSAEGRIELQTLRGGGELSFDAAFPIDREAPPKVVVNVDGAPIDRFVPPGPTVSRRYELPPSATPHVVTFDVSNTVNLSRLHAGDDPRDLGMRLNGISWRP